MRDLMILRAYRRATAAPSVAAFIFLFALFASAFAPAARAAHAYAQFGDIKYPPGFTHFEYVNPDAPKGGEIRMEIGRAHV